MQFCASEEAKREMDIILKDVEDMFSLSSLSMDDHLTNTNCDILTIECHNEDMWIKFKEVYYEHTTPNQNQQNPVLDNHCPSTF